MPRPRLRQHARRSAWTCHHRRVLYTGVDPYGLFTFGITEPGVPMRCRQGWDAPGSVAEMRLKQAVEEIGDELLSQWIEQHPHSRPWHWWRFSAREFRRRIKPPDPNVHGEHWPDIEFGIVADTGDGMIVSGDFETEAAYLDRLGLLTPAEREALNATS